MRFFLCVAFAASVVSCKDKDKTSGEDLNQDDPRIRMVKVQNVPSETMVVNEVEGVIFNYDSIPMGTPVNRLRTYFYGYTSTPTIHYLKDGKWEKFENGEYLDLSEKIRIRSTSEDGKSSFEYEMEVRVHRYDVHAFTWSRVGNLEIDEAVLSQTPVVRDGRYYWFCATESGSSVFVSSDGASWERKSLDLQEADWSSSARLGNLLYVTTAAGVERVSLPDLGSSSFQTERKVGKILFTVDDAIWAIGASDEAGRELLKLRENGTDFEVVSILPKDFPSENLVSFTGISGRTHLGYVYATKGESGTVWGIDAKGQTIELQAADGTLPYLRQPSAFYYDETLGIVGGMDKEGNLSSKCFASYNAGALWESDWHKDLDAIGAISHAGIFVTSLEGEMLLVGGNTAEGVSDVVWKAVLNRLTADDLNYKND